MKHIVLAVVFLTAASILTSAQISAPWAIGSTTTNYTDGNVNDSVFFVCAGYNGQLMAEVSASGQWDFQWYSFQPVGNSWSPIFLEENQNTSYLFNASPGGYKVEATDGNGNVVLTDIAWICRVESAPSVIAQPIPSGCGPIQLVGAFSPGSITPYFNYSPDSPGDDLLGFTGGDRWTASPTMSIPGATTSLNITLNNVTSDRTFALGLTGQLLQAGYCGQYSDTVYYDHVAPVAVSISGTPPPPICAGDEDFVLTGSPSGGSWSGVAIVNTETGQFSPSLAGPGFFSLTYSVTTDGCTSSATQPLLVQSYGYPSIVTPARMCTSDEPIHIASSASGGIWTSVGMADQYSNLFDPSLSGPGIITVQYQMPNLCGGTSIQTIEVLSTPQIDFASIAPVCMEGGQVDLSAQPQGGSWLGQGITQDSLFSPALVGPGNYMAIYQLGGVCPTSDTTYIAVISGPSVSVVSPSVMCTNGSPIVLSASPSGGVWSGQGVNPLTGSFDPALAGVGTHPISYAYTTNCTSTASVNAEVLALPVVSVQSPTEICAQSPSVQLAASPIGGNWSGTGVDGADFNSTQAGVGLHSLTYTYGSVCPVSQTTTIQVWPLPSVSAGDDIQICQGESASLSASGAGLFYWSPPNLVDSYLTAQTEAIPSNTTTYTVAGVDSHGCTATDAITVHVNALPTVTIDSPLYICSGQSGQLTVQGLTSGQWTPNPLIPSLNALSVNVSPSSDQTFQFSGTDANGCPGSATASVALVTENVQVITPDPVCISHPSFPIIGTPLGGTWSGSGVSPSGNFDPQLAGTGLVPLTYSVTYLCTVEQTVNVQVYALPNVSAGADFGVCDNDQAPLNASGALSYQWNATPVLSSLTVSNPIANTHESMMFTVTGTDVNGCSATDDVYVTIYPLPTVNIQSPEYVCFGENVTISQTGLTDFTWSSLNGSLNTQLSPTNYLGVTEDVISVSGIDGNGCAGTASEAIQVIHVTVDLTATPTSGFVPLQVGFDVTSNGDQWNYYFGDGASYSINADIQHTYQTPGVYDMLVLTTSQGCEAIAHQQIVVYPPSDLILVPDIVTPNGDSENDRYRVIAMRMANVEITFFNRWGHKIGYVIGLENEDPLTGLAYSKGWNPIDLEDGVYYFSLTAKGLDGKVFQRDGSFTVIHEKTS